MYCGFGLGVSGFGLGSESLDVQFLSKAISLGFRGLAKINCRFWGLDWGPAVS